MEIYRALVFVAAHLHLLSDVTPQTEDCQLMLDGPFYQRNTRV